MKRLLMLLLCFAALAVAQTAPATVTIAWLGQSTFAMSTSTGLKALLDPANPARRLQAQRVVTRQVLRELAAPDAA